MDNINCIPTPKPRVQGKYPTGNISGNISGNINGNINENINEKIIDSLNRGVQHDFYKFFESNNCVSYPNQRLFNNITKRKMLPNHHFRNCDPVYKS
jgi:hypothetical protein